MLIWITISAKRKSTLFAQNVIESFLAQKKYFTLAVAWFLVRRLVFFRWDSEPQRVFYPDRSSNFGLLSLYLSFRRHSIATFCELIRCVSHSVLWTDHVIFLFLHNFHFYSVTMISRSSNTIENIKRTRFVPHVGLFQSKEIALDFSKPPPAVNLFLDWVHYA